MKTYLIKVYVRNGVYRYTGLFASNHAAIDDAIQRFHDHGEYRIFSRLLS